MTSDPFVHWFSRGLVVIVAGLLIAFTSTGTRNTDG